MANFQRFIENGATENTTPKMRDGQKCRGRKCRAGKCETNMQGWKMRDNRVWKACLRISVRKLMLECKNDNGFSSFNTVMNNSCTLCFVLTLFSVCLLSAVFMDLFLRILTHASEVKRVNKHTSLG